MGASYLLVKGVNIECDNYTEEVIGFGSDMGAKGNER